MRKYLPPLRDFPSLAAAAGRAHAEHAAQCTNACDEHLLSLEALKAHLERQAQVAAYGPGERDTLTERLCGFHRMGPILQNGEPEFGWRQFEGTPINYEAAQEITRLRDIIYRFGEEAGLGTEEVEILLYSRNAD